MATQCKYMPYILISIIIKIKYKIMTNQISNKDIQLLNNEFSTFNTK